MDLELLALPFAAAAVDSATKRGYAALTVAAVLSAAMGFSNPLVLALNSLFLLIAAYSLWYMKGAERPGWYWGWLDAFYGFMLLFLVSDNWLLIAAGWAGLDAASWALILTYRDDEEVGAVGDGGRAGWIKWLWTPSSSALRAIITVELGTAALLIGMAQGARLYGPEVSSWGALPPLAAAMVLAAAFIKAAQLPFTDWLMTAMSAPTPVSALLHSATMVAAGPILLMRLAPQLSPYWLWPLVVGLSTAAYGGLTALWQREPKVLLAASTASYLGLATAFAVLSPAGAEALLLAHAYAKAALFMAVGEAIHEEGSRFPRGYSATAKAAMAISLATLLGFTPLGSEAKAALPAWEIAFSALTAGYLAKLLSAETRGRASPMSALAVAAALLAFCRPAYSFDPIWLVALAGLALARAPHVEAFYRRLYLPLAFAGLGSAASAAFKALGRADAALDKALLRAPSVFLGAARLISGGDLGIDRALHSALPRAVAAASRRIASSNFETYIYAVGILALVVAVAVFLI